MKFPGSVLVRYRTFLWALVPLAMLAFACAAGRDWLYYTPPDFPGPGHSAGTEASISVFSPDERTMQLHAGFQVADPGRQPPLQLAVTGGGTSSLHTTATRVAGAAGSLEVSTPLHLARGVNTVQFALGLTPDTTVPFQVASLRIIQNPCNGGNLLLCFTLSVVAAGSILTARALGAVGLETFCAAVPVGFLLVTASATVLSPFHLLTGGNWAAALLASTLVAGAVSVRRLATRAAGAPSALPAPPENALRLTEGVVLLALVCPVFLLHILLPVAQWDDLMYHGPRTGYWMQHASALPFVVNNDRVAVFPLGGDLLFACGTIVSGAEFPGKFLVFLAFPLTLFCLLALLKNAGVRGWTALALTAVFATTPLADTNAIGIKPDLWLVLLCVATLHWVLAARRGAGGVSSVFTVVLAAACMGAACGIKWTAAPLLALAPFALWLPREKQCPARRLIFPAAAAFTLALTLGGAAPALWHNLRASGHPFGPQAMRAYHQPAPGLHPLLVQMARVPFIIFAPPFVLAETVRTALEQGETAAADALGATERLPLETDRGWPGHFAPKVKALDDGFALGWVFVVAGWAVGVVAGFRRGAERETRETLLLGAGMAFIFGLAVVTQTRWQTSAGLPDRFLLPALALGLCAAARPLDRLVGHSKVRAALLATLLAWHAVAWPTLLPILCHLGQVNGWQAPATAEAHSELTALARQLPPGRTILLFGRQGTRDYPLFLARAGFANRLLPWGKAAYEPAALERALHQPGVDTVVFTDAAFIDRSWEPPLDARPFIADMDGRTDFARVPGTGSVVVYVRK